MNWKRVGLDRSTDCVAPEQTSPLVRALTYQLPGILALTVLLAGLGWLTMKAHHARQQRAVIEALGATAFIYDYNRCVEDGLHFSDPSVAPPGPGIVRWLFGEYVFANIVELELGTVACENLNPALLENLAALDTLEHLSLGLQPVGDSDLECLRSLPNLKELDLTFTAISDEALRKLSGMKHLERLIITHTKITGVGLVHLRNCPLRDLWADDVPFTAEGGRAIASLGTLETLSAESRYDPSTRMVGDEILEGCAKLPRLKEISVVKRPVSDAGLRHLRQLAQLEMLELDRTEITDEGLAHIAALSSLVRLDLGGTKIADRGLAHLCHLTKLETLCLDRSRITDGGLFQLRGLKKLTGLCLERTLVTDQCLEVVKDLPKLKWCNTSNTAVTDEGHARISAQLDTPK